MTEVVKVCISLNAFPGSPEDDGTRACGVGSCAEQVTFWCMTSDEWVCYMHGQLLLKQEWGVLGQPSLVVEAPLGVVEGEQPTEREMDAARWIGKAKYLLGVVRLQGNLMVGNTAQLCDELLSVPWPAATENWDVSIPSFGKTDV